MGTISALHEGEWSAPRPGRNKQQQDGPRNGDLAELAQCKKRLSFSDTVLKVAGVAQSV